MGKKGKDGKDAVEAVEDRAADVGSGESLGCTHCSLF